MGQKILFLIIMRHEGDAFLLSHPLPPFHRLAWQSCLMLMGDRLLIAIAIAIAT